MQRQWLTSHGALIKEDVPLMAHSEEIICDHLQFRVGEAGMEVRRGREGRGGRKGGKKEGLGI